MEKATTDKLFTLPPKFETRGVAVNHVQKWDFTNHLENIWVLRYNHNKATPFPPPGRPAGLLFY
jgi:hypothetical protein